MKFRQLSGRACYKTGYPQKNTSPLGNKREPILCLTCASLRLALSLACVWDFARLVFCPFRLLLANFETNQQWQSRYLLVSFLVWLVSSLETVGPVPRQLWIVAGHFEVGVRLSSVLRSCLFMGSTRSGSYFEWAKSSNTEYRQLPRKFDPKDLSLPAVSWNKRQWAAPLGFEPLTLEFASWIHEKLTVESVIGFIFVLQSFHFVWFPKFALFMILPYIQMCMCILYVRTYVYTYIYIYTHTQCT